MIPDQIWCDDQIHTELDLRIAMETARRMTKIAKKKKK